MIGTMRSESLPLSSLSVRALRTYFVLALIICHGCASDPQQRNVRLTPPQDADPFVVGLGVQPWREICVERPFAEDTPLERFDCIQIGELRAIVKHRLRADN